MSLFNRDTVALLKQDGSKVDGIKATVSGSNIIVISVRQQHLSDLIRIDPNDLLIRTTSVGEETYRVMDPRFYEQSVAGSGPHYQCQVKKLGLPEASAAMQSITYNVSGVNARVNVNSTDNSTNIANINSQATQHIDTLRHEIEHSGLTAEQVQEALEIVDVVQQQFDSGKAKKSVVMALLESIPPIARAAVSIAGLIALL